MAVTFEHWNGMEVIGIEYPQGIFNGICGSQAHGVLRHYFLD